MSHNGAVRLCRSIKLQCEFYPSRSVALCMQPYNGMGIALWCLSGLVIYLNTTCILDIFFVSYFYQLYKFLLLLKFTVCKKIL